MVGVISPLRPRQRLRGQNKSMGIGLIELTEPSDTWNCEPFFKHCILQTILHVILLFKFVWTKYFVPKTKPCYIYIYFFLVRGDIRCNSIKASVFLVLFV